MEEKASEWMNLWLSSRLYYVGKLMGVGQIANLRLWQDRKMLKSWRDKRLPHAVNLLGKTLVLCGN